jgi:hypothetical protein
MKKTKYAIAILALLSTNSLMANTAPTTASPEGAKAYIISPANGDTVASTFTVKFGLKGMGVSPAGLDKKNTGHHHLLVDAKSLPSMKSAMGKNVKHFGGGQTETEITLAPGKHTLQLLLGDKSHVPHNPPVLSEKIIVTVK